MMIKLADLFVLFTFLSWGSLDCHAAMHAIVNTHWLLNWHNGVTLETTVHLAVESYTTFEQTSLSVISLESSPLGTRLICDILEKNCCSSCCVKQHRLSDLHTALCSTCTSPHA